MLSWCFKIVTNVEDLKQSVQEKALAVKKAEEGAVDLKNRVDELSKSLEEHEKEYQVTNHMLFQCCDLCGYLRCLLIAFLFSERFPLILLLKTLVGCISGEEQWK